jgi:hypothetical protein
MFLESLIPIIPSGPVQISIFAVSILGMILLIYSQFLESLKRKDLVRMIGAMCLFIYAIWDNMNVIFMITFAGIAITSLIEFIEVYIGIHREKDHDVVKYKRKTPITK